jgi:hypothetical protein
MPITADTLKKYPNPVFIETGSWKGDGVKAALEAGFENIFTIEAVSTLFEENKIRFATEPRVHPLLGDSSVVLPRILERVPLATIWLDAHESPQPITNANPHPLRAELLALAGTEHTILIDDVRYFADWGVDTKFIEELFPGRTVSFEDGHEPNDILVIK